MRHPEIHQNDVRSMFFIKLPALSAPSAHFQIALAVSAKMRRNTRWIRALSSTIKNVISLPDDFHVRAPVDVVVEILENLGQTYITVRTKDNRMLIRPVCFHMGSRPGMSFRTTIKPILSARLLRRKMPARDPDCARAHVAASLRCLPDLCGSPSDREADTAKWLTLYCR
jgi:hypothetical protein